jgi:hypothetical protein
MQTNPKIKAQTLTAALATSRPIYQTPFRWDWEITTKTQQEFRNTQPLDPAGQKQDQ